MSMAEIDTNNLNGTNIRLIPVSEIRENTYNPNEMDGDNFHELVEEIRHLGRVAKPIVVRPVSDGYEIVDGAHNYRAALAVELPSVPCEVIEVDDFEAMRQTYKRNQHGTHDLIRQGEMFKLMQEAKGLSRRKLAVEIGLCESKMRTTEEYFDAYELRKRCAGEAAEDQIRGLALRQVKIYNRLPDSIHDLWFDAGAPCQEINKRMSSRNPSHEYGFFDAMKFVANCELLEAVSGDGGDFEARLLLLVDYVAVLEKHPHNSNVTPYAAVSAQRGHCSSFIGSIPCYQNGDVAIDLESWTAIVESVHCAYCSNRECYDRVERKVQAWLNENGIAVADLDGCDDQEELDAIAAAPAQLRDAEFLSFDQKLRLATAVGSEPDARAIESLEVVLNELQRRSTETETSAAEGLLQGHKSDDAEDLFYSAVEQLELRDLIAAENELFEADTALEDQIEQRLHACDALRDRHVGGRPAVDELRDRIQQLPAPLFKLVAALMVDDPVIEPEARWLEAVEAVS
jgi:hypothetical protein